MSEEGTETAPEQVASPAEQAGLSPALAAHLGEEHSGTLESMIADEPAQEEPTEEVIEPTEEVQGESTEEAPAEQSEEKPFTLKVKGQDISVSEKELIALAQKGQRFTQKSQELSEEAKLGLQYKQAQSGDKEAMRAILDGFVGQAGLQDLDSLIDSLENVKGNIDTSKLEAEAQDKQDMDRAFEGVNRKSPEFSSNLDFIETEAKNYLPQDLYSKIIANPDNLKQLYDMVDDGSFQETMNLMQVRLAGQGSAAESAVMSNQEKFGEMFDSIWDGVVAIRSSSAEHSPSPNAEQTQTQAQPASSVDEPPVMASGTRRTAQADSSGEVDYFNDDEAYRKRVERVTRGY